MFLGLGHDAVGAVDHEDRAVHLGSAGDHVLDVVSVTGAVDVRIVAVVALIFNVGGGDRQDLGGVAATLGLGSLGNLVVGDVVCETLHVLDMRDRSGKSGFAVVDVTDGTDVDVRFGSCERFLCHFLILLGVVRLASRMFSVLLCVKGYSCMIRRGKWSLRPESNRGPHPYQGCALPAELRRHHGITLETEADRPVFEA